MEKEREIEERIVELKWKALPLVERLLTKKSSLKDLKYRTKSRFSELKWYNKSCSMTICIFLLLSIYLLSNEATSNELRWFSVSVLGILLAQKLELWLRYNYLSEVFFLKKIKKEL